MYKITHKQNLKKTKSVLICPSVLIWFFIDDTFPRNTYGQPVFFIYSSTLIIFFDPKDSNYLIIKALYTDRQ